MQLVLSQLWMCRVRGNKWSLVLVLRCLLQPVFQTRSIACALCGLYTGGVWYYFCFREETQKFKCFIKTFTACFFNSSDAFTCSNVLYFHPTIRETPLHALRSIPASAIGLRVPTPTWPGISLTHPIRGANPLRKMFNNYICLQLSLTTTSGIPCLEKFSSQKLINITSNTMLICIKRIDLF